MRSTLLEPELFQTEANACPSCQGPLTADLACWNCCDRLCRVCGQQTGTAFIDICWPCWFQENRGDCQLR